MSEKDRLHDPGYHRSDVEAPVALPSPTRIMVSFVLMALCFSLNHGTVTALIALAAPDLGNLGRYSTGTLYFSYTLVALVLSGLIVEKTGFKWGLVWGLVVYCAYVVSFLFSRYVPDIKDEAALIGSGIGGIAAGFLWTAQGGYFTSSAKVYAQSKSIPVESATAHLSGVFAAFYLGCEVTIKLLASALQEIPNAGQVTVFITYSFVAVLSSIGMMLVDDLPRYLPVDPNKPRLHVTTKLLAASRLLATDPRMALLLPAQISFGVISVFLNSYANANIVSSELGKSNVGYLAAVVAGTAAAMSLPLGSLAKRFNKLYMLTAGGVLFLLEASLFISFTDHELGTWAWCVPLYMLHGAGRSVWEGTNKAVMADFFPDDAPAAFANVIVASGLASAICFFVFPNISRTAQLVVCIVACALHIVCSWAAFAVHAKRQKQSKEMLL